MDAAVAGAETEAAGAGVAAVVAAGERETGATVELAGGVTVAAGAALPQPATRTRARSSRTVAL